MSVAKPKGDSKRYARDIADKFFKEKTGMTMGEMKKQAFADAALSLIPGAAVVAKPAQILKPYAAARVVATGAKSFPKIAQPATSLGKQEIESWIAKAVSGPLRGVLRAPQKELSRVKDITMAKFPDEAADILGIYNTILKNIKINAQALSPKLRTIYHELVHGRQFEHFPPITPYSPLISGFNKAIEAQANLAANTLAKGRLPITPGQYDAIYKRAAAVAARRFTDNPEKFLQYFGQ